MRRRLCFSLLGLSVLGVLGSLAGCARSFVSFEQREAWRHEAEVTCLKSGTVKETSALVRISPIEGPGICGADFPLKVAALGESSALGFADDIRPPGSIPKVNAQPRWPVAQPSYPPTSMRPRPRLRTRRSPARRCLHRLILRRALRRLMAIRPTPRRRRTITCARRRNAALRPMARRANRCR